jgi:hypothetical protein
MQSDVLRARSVLRPLGVDPNNVSSGWHKGNMSLIVKCESGVEVEALDALLHRTSINIPIVVLPMRSKKTFKFNFKAS